MKSKGLDKEKLQEKWQKVKEAIKQNKEKVISVTAGTVALIVLAMVMLVQTSQNGRNAISPELARAMNYAQVKKGEEAVEGTDNVKFDAFFLRDINNDGYAESIRGTCKEIGKEDTLYMELNVQTAGYLKDAKITVEGKNFYLHTSLPKDQELQENYIGVNTKEIKFNQLKNGTQKMLTAIVRSGDYSYDSAKAAAIGNNINNYSQVNSVTLTGTYVDENNQETKISKTVNFNIDWYGTTKANVDTTTQNKDIVKAIDENAQAIDLDFTIYTEETMEELILSKNHVEGEIPKLNGYAPTNVVYTGSNANFNYNQKNSTFTIDRIAQVAEDGKLTIGIGRINSYNIKATYPLEAYRTIGSESVQLKVPVKTYYEGYNNQEGEFINPYQSNIAQSTVVVNYENPNGEITKFSIDVGKLIYDKGYRSIVSKEKPLKLYNGKSEQEKEDRYVVKWTGYIQNNINVTGMIMKETKNGEPQVNDKFIKNNGEKESANDVVSNVGIYFSRADEILGENGWIKVYDDETGNLLGTFTKNNWNQYTSSNPYEYAIPVKHIRVETSEVVKDRSHLYVYNIKEIDDEKITNQYTKEEFDQLQYIESNLVGYTSGKYIETVVDQAHYEAPMSVATIKISKNTISTQETEKNDKITIQTETSSNQNKVEWKNGIFLVKLPEEIIDVKLNEVTIDNSSVNLESYEIIEKNGQKFIKIVTQNDVARGYDITLDVDLTADPRIATTTKQIELYASNENESDYYNKAQDEYDINHNSNKEEMVNYTTASISMISPNSLLTNQTASNYDKKGSIIISPQTAEIRPNYAVVDHGQEQTATIGVQIKNNYASNISEIKLLGKIPFQGNTYVISENDLGSNFTTKMTSEGIQVPEEIAKIANVYYSENEKPDRDLSKKENGWKTASQVENWNTVKTFLIDLGNYTMPTGKEFVFHYVVKIPNGLAFNQVAYSHHGVYFSLDTEEGKYRTQTEPNKLGFRIAEKYGLQLNKYQIGKEKVVSGATYSVREIIQKEDGTESIGEVKTGTTNSEGSLEITNLYAERLYEIKEIKTPDNYELSNDVIRFIGHVDKQGTLTVEKKQGNTKGEITVAKNDGENYQIGIKVEDEVKASINITKKEKGTENRIARVRYKMTGYGLPENGKIVNTNTNGETTVKGLSINREYTLQEVKAEGYYLASPIKFKIVSIGGKYIIVTTEGEITNQTTTEEDSIPAISIILEDEKIPTYNLEITKIKRITQTTTSEDSLVAKAEGNLATSSELTYLPGVKFRLYKGNEQIGEYVTDSEGKISITNLYQYVNEKDVDQTYILKEVMAPDGYAKVKDITFKVEKIGGELNFQETEQEGTTKKNYTVEGNTIQLIVEDSPSFQLIKKDAETKLPIANAKFAIYNVDNEEKPATNSKGEIIGNKEIINGKECYTVATNENGELTEDLTEGLYKVVEVQAPEQYDIAKSTKYFGIGASKEGKIEQQAQWVSGTEGSKQEYIYSVVETKDGGMVTGGCFSGDIIELGNGVTLTNKSTRTSYHDGMVIKYDEQGVVEWANNIGGDHMESVNSVAETKDGGIVVGGYFGSNTINLGNGVTLSNNTDNDYAGMVIKYNAEGKAQWAKTIGGATYGDHITSVAGMQDGGIVVGGYFNSETIDLGNGVKLTNQSSNSDGMVIKYNAEGKAQWAKNIGARYDEEVNSVVGTEDGGVAVGGYFKSATINLGNGVSLTNNGTTSKTDGMVIKYNKNGTAQWAKSIGGSEDDTITSVVETEDGGVAIGGNFKSSTIDLGNGVNLTNNGTTSYIDGMVIRYDKNGGIQWAKSIGGSDDDSITSVAKTKDGGILIGGDFEDSEIDLEKEEIIKNHGSFNDGMIIKYNQEGKMEWAKSIGGSSSDYITSVVGTEDGGYAVGGYFLSDVLDLGNGAMTFNTGNEDGMIIKYKPMESPDVIVKEANGIQGTGSDEIAAVAETQDGGYVVGGHFESGEINLGNGVNLINASTGKYYADGMIIKYNKEGKAEWAKRIGGDSRDEITSVVGTNDGGILVGGYFLSSVIDLENGVSLRGNGGYNGMIIKYNEKGEVQWAKNIQKNSYDDVEVNSVAETQDGGFVVGGYFSFSKAVDLGNGIMLSNNGSYDGMVIKYNAQGEAQWAKTIGGSNSEEIDSVVETKDGGIVVGGRFSSSTVDLGNGISLTNNATTGKTDGMVIKYDKKGKAQWAKSLGGSENDYVTSVAEMKDGGIAVGGYFRGSEIYLESGEVLKNHGNKIYDDGMIIKYSKDGKLEWANGLGGDSDDRITSVAGTEDGGILVGGEFSDVNVNLISNGSYDGMVIKYDKEGKLEWEKGIGGNSSDYVTSVVETQDGEVVAGGYFSSSTIDLGNEIMLSNKGRSDGMLVKMKAELGVPEVQEVAMENVKKEFKITTNVKRVNGTKGGTISGEEANPYEKVKYGENSTQKITMIPDTNYEIIGITVNGEEYPFVKNSNGTYTMPQFVNMTEDKHVEVMYSLKTNKITINKVDSKTKLPLKGATFKINDIELTTNSQGQAITQLPFGKYTITEVEAPEGYELNKEPIEIDFTASGSHEFTIENTEAAKLIVHHYKAIKKEDGTYEYTKEKLAEDDYSEEKVGEPYITGPSLDIQKYEPIKDLKGDYIIPENANGKYVSGTTEVTYYYEEGEIPLTVHHYIEGTTTKVPLKDGTEAQDVTNKGKEGENYQTAEIEDSLLSKNYELVETPENANGIYEGNEVIVTYYYKLATPIFENSKITKTTETEKITKEKQVVDYTINYQTKVDKYIGKATITVVDNLPYEIDEETSNLAGGIYDAGTKTITWTEEREITKEEESGIVNITKQINVVYQGIDMRPEKEPELEEQQKMLVNTATGTIKLETPEAEDKVEVEEEIPIKAEIDITVNKIWNDNEIQAQRRPEAIIIQIKDEKGETVGSKEVSALNQVEGTDNQWAVTFEDLPKYDENGNEILYTVQETVLTGEDHKDDLKFYTEEVTNVEDGQATIRNTFTKPADKIELTIKKIWEDSNNENNKRPAAIKLQLKNEEEIIKEQEISAAQAKEDDESVWEYTFTDLDKYDENGQEIVYTVDEKEIAKDELKFYEKSIEGTTITNTFAVPDEKTTITVNKVWVDNEMQANKRPETIVIQLKKGEEIVGTYELNTKEETSHTFTDLVRYDSRGNEIQYTVEELEKTEGDLHFYQQQIGTIVNGTVTITNTFKKPDDTTNVVVTKVWEDNDNEAEKRPESIKLQLKSGNDVVKEQTITSENTWSHTFNNVPKYDDNGREIEYTADEAEVNQEDLKFYHKEVKGTTITNTFTQNTEKINITATKVWEDTKAQKDKRPSSIIIQLKRNEAVVDSKEVPINQEQDQYEVVFEDMPKYDKYNNLINYTIDEEEKEVGDLKFYDKTINGMTITNAFLRPDDTIAIEIEKQWVDQTDRYSKRPSTITLQVKKGEEIVAEKVITKEDNWKQTFINLPKYDENGNEIAYSVKEVETNEGDLFYYTPKIEIVEGEDTVNHRKVRITNTMTKMPAFVEVKYVDIKTKEEIEDPVEKEDILGEEFDVSENKKEIPGYTLVEEPEEKTGTYTEEKQTKIYYYAKNTEVIVKYLEKGTNRVLTEKEEYVQNGYEGQNYTTEKKVIEGYTFIESTGKVSGQMEREPIVVIYYYLPSTQVIVKYLEKDDTPEDNSDNEVLALEETIYGYVGKDYKAEEKEIPDYKVVGTTNNTEGQMTKDPIEVIYYYAKKTKVMVKYLEKDNTPDDNTDNKVLANEEVMDGYVGDNYTTESKTIENYVLAEATENTKGQMTKDTIEVIYYYARSTKATVLHIDKDTGEILGQRSENGKVGDVFETHARDFEKYVLVEEPDEPNVIMTEEEQVLKYYYQKISAGVVEKHIDDITGELLASDTHTGKYKEEYHISAREFSGYDLVTTKLPENAEGIMQEELIEVKYYYIRRASVRVEYMDQETGNKLTEDEIQQGHQNDDYTTNPKDIKGYTVVETPENATGKMTITKNEDGTYTTETVVTYYYVRQAGGVTEKHIDIQTNKVLAEQEHKGIIGQEYDIKAREFNGYELVEDKLPNNSKGQMTANKIEVIYYYVKVAKVRVEYLDKQTGEKIDEDEIKGKIGDSYETEEKQFEGYDLIEVPSNGKGEMKEKETVVKYYYLRRAEVEIQYLEKDSHYKLAENNEIKGYVGDKYETTQKEIPYYKFVESTTNTKGNMTKDKITVIYYYQKQIFNLSVDKWVSKVNMNGITMGAKDFATKDELYKLDIHRNKVANADVKVTYTIRISNKGEIEGTVGRITELIPGGYSFHQEDNDIHWEENGGILISDVLKNETIQPDEHKEIQIVLRWNPGEDNFGNKKNTVLINELINPAGYQDIDKEDNSSKSDMLLSVATGLDRNDRIIIIGIVQIVLAISFGLLVSYKKKEN